MGKKDKKNNQKDTKDPVKLKVINDNTKSIIGTWK